MDSLFHKLEYEAFRKGIQGRTKESRAWFKSQIKSMANPRRHDLLKDPALKKKQRFGVGNMYMYFYDPKLRKTLPYYDMFPLTIMVDKAPGGFYGLNLHYLPMRLRAQLFDNLLSTLNNKRYDESTKFKVNYGMLKSTRKMKAFAPCFKHYLTNHVASQIVMVEPPEWEIAMWLPTQQWAKQKQSVVWNDSREIISNY